MQDFLASIGQVLIYAFPDKWVVVRRRVHAKSASQTPRGRGWREHFVSSLFPVSQFSPPGSKLGEGGPPRSQESPFIRHREKHEPRLIYPEDLTTTCKPLAGKSAGPIVIYIENAMRGLDE